MVWIYFIFPSSSVSNILHVISHRPMCSVGHHPCDSGVCALTSIQGKPVHWEEQTGELNILFMLCLAFFEISCGIIEMRQGEYLVKVLHQGLRLETLTCHYSRFGDTVWLWLFTMEHKCWLEWRKLH